jgi:hypothetical protein
MSSDRNLAATDGYLSIVAAVRVPLSAPFGLKRCVLKTKMIDLVRVDVETFLGHLAVEVLGH